MDNTILHAITDSFVKIGYKRWLIRKDYQYADLFSSEITNRTVQWAIFGQEPLDYRSACFGLQIAEPDSPSDVLVRELRALGAPQIFIFRNGTAERWVITGGEPRLQDKYNTFNLPNVIIQNEKDWNPQDVIRAKAGFAKPGSVQLDFIDIGLLPALDSEAARKIDLLLRVILNHTEVEVKKYDVLFDASLVFKIVFSLLAAKLLKDRNVPNSAGIDFSLPQTALRAVSNHYGSSLLSVASKLPLTTLKAISEEIGRSFSLSNISVDTLTYVYENTFVSRESRRHLGIHSTPSYVADYILSQIPISTLPRTQWHATDPMSGHGIFLIASMRKMRSFLPHDWSGRQRHRFFASHLHGVEIEPFAVEVARMCLMLADFPEPNGWDLINADVFSGKRLENAMAKTMILVANPPFENIKDRVPEIPKPVELLRRAIPALPDGAFIGLVLPRSFTDGSDYAKERIAVMDNLEIISITTLPDRVFRHSDMETVILIAQKHRPHGVANVVYREVKDGERREFRVTNRVTWEDKVPQSYFKEKMQSRFIVPLLREIWECLGNKPRLSSIAKIKKGVEYKLNIDFEKVVRPTPFPNSRPGIAQVTRGFSQFVTNDTVYMSVDRDHRRLETSSAWDLPWDEPKIVLPASRMSRGPWRYAAAIDKEGRIVSRSFYGVWPKADDMGVEILAAILNSPVATAFVYAHSSQRTVPKRAYKDIPIPELSLAAKRSIHSLVLSYLDDVKQDTANAKKLLLGIDAEILRQYDLPPRLERQLLDVFWGYQRPVPFAFTGYVPPAIDSWIPLHFYISEQFSEATPDRIMQRIPIIRDKEFINYLKNLGREK